MEGFFWKITKFGKLQLQRRNFSLFTRMQCVLTNSKYSSANSSEEKNLRGRERERDRTKWRDFSEKKTKFGKLQLQRRNFSLFTRMKCVLTNSKYSSANSSEEKNFRGREREREREIEQNGGIFRKKNKVRQTPTSTEEFFTFHTDAVCLN